MNETKFDNWVELGNGAPLEQSRFGSLLGSAPEMQRLYALIARVAPSEATVLIQGETGTGKELVARELHCRSPRARGPFVVVDCSAIAANVIESELFGHAKGAFSGAVIERRGLFEEAHGGTLYLDEIGELPLCLQAKLLRVLEAREVRRVGANSVRSVDVRLVAATNRPLARSAAEGTFREDLYYRLAVVEMHLPPLRARREDIVLLAEHFYQRMTGSSEPLPPELRASVNGRSFPGNVRELRNFVERCVTIGTPCAEGPSSVPADADEPRTLPAVALPISLHLPLKDARLAALERFERYYVECALRQTGGNVTRAAERAGVSRRFLQRMMARLEIRGGGLEALSGPSS